MVLTFIDLKGVFFNKKLRFEKKNSKNHFLQGVQQKKLKITKSQFLKIYPFQFSFFKNFFGKNLVLDVLAKKNTRTGGFKGHF